MRSLLSLPTLTVNKPSYLSLSTCLQLYPSWWPSIRHGSSYQCRSCTKKPKKGHSTPGVISGVPNGREGSLPSTWPSCIMMQLTFICCEDTVLLHAQWAQATSTAMMVFSESEAQEVQVSSGLSVLLHYGHLAASWELFLMYPSAWLNMGTVDCLFGCQWNSPALFLLLFFHHLTMVMNSKQMFSVSK